MSALAWEPGSTAGIPSLLVADCGVDACLVRNGERGLLVVSPGQTFDSAVAAAVRVLPHLGETEVRSLLRPRWSGGSMDFDAVLPGYSTRWVARTERNEDRHNRLVALLFVAVLGLLAVISVWLTYTGLSG